MGEPNRDKPIALDAYEKLAEAFATLVDTKSYNAYLDRPAVFSLLPDVKGKRVLDAGCGPGVYSEWLVNNEAKVVGIDVSPKMLKFARQRLGDRAELIEADLSKPLTFLEDTSFDLVVSALVLSYIADWHGLFREFNRILRPGGFLVFSTDHPCNPWTWKFMKNYFSTEYFEGPWSDPYNPDKKILVPQYRRSLNAMMSPLEDNGFQLDKILEAFPIDEFRRADPEGYKKTSTRPSFICVRVRKPSGT